VPRCPLLLATVSTIDISVDTLAKACIAEAVRRLLVNAELATALARHRAFQM
jgi:hypothetical protein